MSVENLENQIAERGREFFSSISGEAPSLFNKARWTGKVMDWCMRNEAFKIQLFRFVDVFPTLTTAPLLTRHIKEYFGGEDQDVPAVLKWGAKSAGLGGALGAKVLNVAIRRNIQEMGRQFIIGDDAKSAVKGINRLRKDQFAFTIDVLGEATLSEDEAEQYVASYLDLLGELAQAQAKWTAPDGASAADGDPALDWGCAPRINVSVKPTAFYSQARPARFEDSVQGILKRLIPIFERVVSLGGFMCVDMESHAYKDITLEVYRRLRGDERFRHYPHLGIVLQSYLRETDDDLEQLLAWAREQRLPLSIRLVKGAYWDYETVLAKQNGWEIPVYTHKPESDAAFERHARQILESHELCHLACGSHNIRSIAAVLETARALGVPDERYEFQVLYGMAEPVRKGLRNIAHRIRLYCPYGDLIPGMAYLVRRLLENTANESFLRQSFVEEHQIDELLEDPRQTLERQLADAPAQKAPTPNAFFNESVVDFTIAEQRRAFPAAIADVRRQLGRTYALHIDGQSVETDDRMPSRNPADPDEIVGHVCQADVSHVAAALAAAKRAFPTWRDTPPAERAQYLVKAAAAARKRMFELCAWQVLEVGKQWDQAHGDVTEAIDFLEFYAREMTRLGALQRLGNAPGEINHYFYEPKGIAAVIAPWNFPLAIACGMVSAAIVAGDCVVFKPSGFSSVVGHHLVEIFREAGLPPGVFNYTPGRGRVMGDFLVEHPDVSLIAFTGSMEVGLRIIEKAAKVQPGQVNVKKVIAEMGGKNALIIDDDADLDEAVPAALYSAFGFQGQKCSACSRVIVLDAVYDRFVARLIEAARSLKVGPSEDPANAMGPVVDASAQKSILEYVDIGKTEGELLYQSPVPDAGYYVPLTIIGGIRPEHRLAQEEVFGPVLAVMRARDFDQALEWANGTQFALTGGLFSRSPQNLERARREFRVGNLYLNRHITGALVGRQPFGGSQMSGVGTKAGGSDYLLHFMDPRAVTENTMRRGFAPIEDQDDWV